MRLSDYLILLRRSWILLLVLILAGAGAGYGLAALQTPKYTAAAKSYLSTGTAGSIGDLSVASSYIQQITASFADIATTSYVLRDVIDTLHLQTTPAQLKKEIEVTAVTGESVLQIQVTDRSPQDAAAVANALAARLSTAVAALTPPTATGKEPLRVTLVDPAVPPAGASSPSVVTNVAIGALLGLVVALLLAVLRDLLATKLRDVEEAAALTDLPVLGATVRTRNARSNPVLNAAMSHTPRAESFRTIRSNLAFLDVDRQARSIVITSSVSGEGKSTSAVNLALTLADLGERVILVDADLRRPRVAEYLGLDGGLGLTDVLIGRVDLTDAVQLWGSQNLAVLPTGAIPPNPNELLQSNAMRTLIEELNGRYDIVLFDAPPLLPVSDAAVLARQTGGAIVVAAAGTVHRTELAAAVARLRQAQARPLGVVVTMLPVRGADARMYGQRGYAGDAGADAAPMEQSRTRRRLGVAR